MDTPRSLIDKADYERVQQEMIESRPPPSYAAGLTRSIFGQGVGMGWGDEAEAWIRSKLGGGDYGTIRKDINKDYGRFAARNPVSSAVGEFAGGAAPAVAAMMMAPATGGATAPAAAAGGSRAIGALSRVAQNPYARSAGISSAQGAVSGAGSADPGSRGSGAVGGAILGAGIGAAAPVVMRGAGAGLNWARERVLPSDRFVDDRALQKITRALESDGLKPKDILYTMKGDEFLGVPSTVANTSEGLMGLADVVAQRTGKGARDVRRTLSEQKEGVRERAMDQTRKGLSDKNYFEDEARAVSELRGSANTLYDEAYAFGDVMDPRIMKVLEHPRFASFFEKAQKISETEALAAELSGSSPAKFQLKQLYKPKNDKDGNLVGFDLVGVPDVRTLDYIKRGIDATIDSGFRGEGMSKAEANALKELRKIYVKSIDEATTDPTTGVSAYSNARKKYAGDMEVIDAMRGGYKEFGSSSNEQISALFKEMSEAEKEAYRTGATRFFYDKIMNPSNDMNAAKRLIGSPEMRKKLEVLFDSPAKYQLYKAAMERESEMFNQASKALGGSPTIARDNARESFEEGSNIGELVGNAISGGWLSSLTNAAARAVSNVKMTDDVAERVSKMLMSKRPQDVANAVQQLEDFAAAQAPTMRRLNAAEVGTGTGLTTAMPSAPPSDEAERDIERDIRIRNAPLDQPINMDEELMKWKSENSKN